MPLLPEDEVVTCPYNMAHQILKARLHTHLVRCRSPVLNYFCIVLNVR